MIATRYSTREQRHGEIQLEDARICEIVQRNLRSQSYSRGRYSVKQERGLHHFHSLYAKAMQL